MYGLKQSPRQWYLRFDEFMVQKGYERSSYDNCVYHKWLKNGIGIFLLLYVDDMLIASVDRKEIVVLKEQLASEFEMKDLGKVKRILGMQVMKNEKLGELRISQENYLQKALSRFGMQEAKSILTLIAQHFKLSHLQCPSTVEDVKYISKVPYSNVIGCLMYAMICSRPDLAYAASLISRFMSNLGKMHWQAIKWVLRYVRAIVKHGLLSKKSEQGVDNILGFCDSDYCGDLDRRRSLTGFCFTLFRNVVSWKASLQPIMALSTTEAEFMALTEAMKEAL